MNSCAGEKLEIAKAQVSLAAIAPLRPTAKVGEVFARLLEESLSVDAIEGIGEIQLKQTLSADPMCLKVH